jgi:UDP-N-acetylmuramyl pentapeptide phosphotransferase/UDP-N-acetylglucosamine-1-phosphate transferase
MGIELTILLGLVIIAIVYFFFRKTKDITIPEDVVKTEQHIKITPEPIGGVSVVAEAVI